jgi:hypothetical protein
MLAGHHEHVHIACGSRVRAREPGPSKGARTNMLRQACLSRHAQPRIKAVQACIASMLPVRPSRGWEQPSRPILLLNSRPKQQTQRSHAHSNHTHTSNNCAARLSSTWRLGPLEDVVDARADGVSVGGCVCALHAVECRKKWQGVRNVCAFNRAGAPGQVECWARFGGSLEALLLPRHT